MAQRLTCPECGLRGEVPNGYRAKHIRCVRCQARFPVDPESRRGSRESSGRPTPTDFEEATGDEVIAPATPPTWLVDDELGPFRSPILDAGAPFPAPSTTSQAIVPALSDEAVALTDSGDEPRSYEIISWHAKLAGLVGVVQFPLVAFAVLASRHNVGMALEPWQAWIALALSILVLFLIPLLAGGVLVLVDAARLLRGNRTSRWRRRRPSSSPGRS